MDDKTIMETILSDIKGGCDLMLHGSIESTTSNVHSTFKTALNDSLNIQNEIYSKMASKGWYQTETAEQQKIDAARQKFASQG